MTWLWVKKRRVRIIFFFLTFLLTIIHNTTAETTTTTTTTGGGGGTVNSSDYTPYLDVTKFVDGVNNWDFMGVWAKYDLTEFTEDTLPVPLVPDGEDQGVFICQVCVCVCVCICVCVCMCMYVCVCVCVYVED